MTDAKKPPVRRSTQEIPKVSAKQIDPSKTVRLDSQPDSERWEGEADEATTMQKDKSEPNLGKTLKLGDPPKPIAVPAPPLVPGAAAAKAPRPSSVPSRQSEPPKSGIIEGIELIVVEERQQPTGERRPWRAAEVWTKRRVYGLDSTFRCVEILDRQTGRPEPSHELLGARLGGGRQRDKDKVRFSYPLPLPGMEAMFSKGKKHGYTSAVERMVVRVRVLNTSPDEAAPSWDDIASRWSEPPPPRM